MVCDGDVATFIIAVDAATGKTKWRRDREAFNSFTTPLVYDAGKDGIQLIILGGKKLLSYSLSTGEPLWWLNKMPLRPKSSPFFATAKDGTPLMILSAQTPGEDPNRRDFNGKFSEMVRIYGADDKGRVSLKSVKEKTPKGLQTPTLMDSNGDGFISEEEFTIYEDSYSSPNIIGAVRMGPGMKGDIESRVAWRRDRFVPNTPTPVAYQGVLYVLKEGGILSAFDVETGEPFKQGRIKGAMEQYLASPVAGDGKLYTVSDAGHLAVLQAGREWEILAVNDLDEPTAATPALDNGRIFVRTKEHLYCFKQQ
jgi:outer membrane protein assembly factor BamB